MEDPTIKRFLVRLRELRKHHRLTQEKFAEIAGISYKYYQFIETGRRKQLRLPTLIRLAKAYGIGVHELLAPEMPKTTVKIPGAKKMRRPRP